MAVIQYTTGTTGTVTCSNTQQNVQVIHDAGVTATLTIAFPATPFNGQEVSMMSVVGVVALTLSASVGTIINTITTLAAGISASYMYITSQTKWYKIQ